MPRSNDFDILTWWNANSLKCPTLQKVARNILVILVSTVAIERAFNTSDRFVSLHRNRLYPNMLKALMCARDWLWSKIYGIRNTIICVFIFVVFLIYYIAN